VVQTWFSVLRSVQTNFVARSSSYSMRTYGSFPCSKAAEVWSSPPTTIRRRV
jgi:hypothetical protein